MRLSSSSLPSSRKVVALVVTLSAFAVLIALVACSFIVTDVLPAGYTCLPDAGSAVCPPNQVCAPTAVGTQFTCVDKCTLTSQCRSGYWCDPVGWCVSVTDSGPPDGSGDVVEASTEGATDAGDGGADAGVHMPCTTLGCRCSVNAECPTGLACVDKATATTDIWNAWIDSGVGANDGTGAGICMEPCCKSSDCDMGDGGAGGYVCFATGGGDSFCVAPEWLGDRGAIGAIGGGAACGGDAGACRSGLCSTASVCVDTCCSSRTAAIDCTIGSSCVFGAFPGGAIDMHEAARCVPVAGPGVSGGGCRTGADCRSNLCLGGGGNGTCRDACRNALDCSPGGGRSPNFVCTYILPNSPQSTEIVAACMPTGGNQGDAGGPSVCFTNDDCTQNHPCVPQPMVVGGATYSVLECAP